jgi:hypothetical protein
MMLSLLSFSHDIGGQTPSAKLIGGQIMDTIRFILLEQLTIN